MKQIDERFPCKREDCDTINAILGDVAQLQAAVQKCVNCNLPMQDQLDQLQARRKLLEDLKREFFPGEE